MDCENACPICYEPMYVRGHATFFGSCGHAYHVACLNANVEAGNKSSCPMCNLDWEPDRVVVTPRRRCHTLIRVMEIPEEPQEEDPFRLRVLAMSPSEQRWYYHLTHIDTVAPCFSIILIIFMGVFVVCTSDDLAPDAGTMVAFKRALEIHGAFYMLFYTPCYALGLCFMAVGLTEFQSFVSKMTVQYPYATRMALRAAACAAFFGGERATRFVTCASCEIAAFALHYYFWNDARISWARVERILFLCVVVAAACSVGDPKAFVAVPLLVAGWALDKRAQRRFWDYTPLTHVLLIALTLWVCAVLNFALIVHHPHEPYDIPRGI